LRTFVYTVYPQGENTLTVRNGKRALLKALLQSESLDKIKGDEGVSGMIGDILASPVLRGVFCEGRRFTFNPKSANLARINRAELGRFDALVLGLLLIAQFKGQLVLPKFGFYGRDAHMNLIEEDRLVAGINTLAELSPLLAARSWMMPKSWLSMNVSRGVPTDSWISLQQKSRPARRPLERYTGKRYTGKRLLAVCGASLIALSHLRVLDGFFDISDSAAGRSLGLLQLALRL
jgi:hypothetical protein